MRLRDITLVSLSAGALITLVTGTALGLDRRVEAWIADASQEQPAPVVVADEDVRPLPIRPSPASAAVAGAPAEAAAREPAGPEPVRDGTVVPDLDGMRVGQARRLMRVHGLRLVVRDDLGLAIAPEDSASYRIRGELDPPAGTAVEPGTTVRARARNPRPVIFSGY